MGCNNWIFGSQNNQSDYSKINILKASVIKKKKKDQPMNLFGYNNKNQILTLQYIYFGSLSY